MTFDMILIMAVAVFIIAFWLSPGRRRGRPSQSHLSIVKAERFERKRVMNKGEYRVFAVIEAALKERGGGYRVLAQVSLGEMLSWNSKRATYAVNSKRVDITVIDRSGWPVAAFEYQGEGHYQGNARDRDAVKREALRKAGIAYIEIMPKEDEKLIRAKLEDALLRRDSFSQGQRQTA